MVGFPKFGHKCIISDIPVFYEIKQPISSKGLHPPHPLLHIWFKTSLYLLKYELNFALGVILIWCYINKVPCVASGGCTPRPPAPEITSIFRPLRI